MVQWLRIHTVLCPVPTSSSSQLPVTPTPGVMTLSSGLQLSTLMFSVHAHTQVENFLKGGKRKLYPILVMEMGQCSGPTQVKLPFLQTRLLERSRRQHIQPQTLICTGDDCKVQDLFKVSSLKTVYEIIRLGGKALEVLAKVKDRAVLTLTQ